MHKHLCKKAPAGGGITYSCTHLLVYHGRKMQCKKLSSWLITYLSVWTAGGTRLGLDTSLQIISIINS